MPPRLRQLPTAALTPVELVTIRELMDRAFGTGEHGFTNDDWDHSLGGLHFVLDDGGALLTHASVVERVLEVDGRPLRTGYVEAVATAPDRQGQGHGTVVMEAVTEYVRSRFELGALGTGSQAFYERLGWEIWRGPAFVRTPAGGTERTAEEEGYILVLRTAASPPFELTEPISCDWRPGDVW